MSSSGTTPAAATPPTTGVAVSSGGAGPSSAITISPDELRSLVQSTVRQELAASSSATIPPPSTPAPATVVAAGLGSLPASASLAHVPTLSSTPSTTLSATTSTMATAPICSVGLLGSLLTTANPVKPSPFVLASAIPPIPGKVVQRVMADEFIDLRELLPDNVSLLEKLEGLPAAPGGTRPRLREVSSLLTWCTCVLKLIAVQAHKPDQVRQMCAYMCLVIQEARKQGGDGWSTYDRLFRQHAAANLGLSWATLDGSIHAATFLASRTGSGTHCRLCADSDHLAHECALTPLLSPGQPARSIVPSQPLPYRHTQSQFPSSPSPARPICNSWNRGKCAYVPVCGYRHICATCQEGSHQAKDCLQTPADSIFRRPPLPCQHFKESRP